MSICGVCSFLGGAGGSGFQSRTWEFIGHGIMSVLSDECVLEEQIG